MMNKNWITNKAMKDLFTRMAGRGSNEEVRLNVQELYELFTPPFKKVKDCILITKKNSEDLEPHLEKTIATYGDRTGYEASNTEMRISTCIENDISVEACTKIALLVIDVWSLQLKKIEPHSKFCFILCSNNERVEIRFHQFRKDEGLWLAENLDLYIDGAVGYIII